ncbi:MAG: cell division FtsA domain-containing protein, partial [Desulfobacterales bacterium]
SDRIKSGETIDLPDIGSRKGRKLPRQILAEILEPRVEEIFALIRREINRAGMNEEIASGIVLTGGASLLDGIGEVAESVFEVPVRRGMPHGISGLVDVVNNPMYATGVGLVLYGARDEERKKFRIRDTNIFHRIINRMKRWFNEVV